MKVSFNKTKIIATYGPACADKNKMSDLVHAGVDVFRFNFSHGSHEQHLEGFTFVKELAEELNINIGILADLQGPKIRLGKVRDNHEVLETGQTVEITNIECVSTFKRLYVSYDALPQEAQPGEKILIDDGKIELQVIETNNKDTVLAKVITGGKISSNKGVNLPDTKTTVPALTEKDKEDLEFAVNNGANWIALSFVRSPQDVQQLKDIIGQKNSYLKVMAKIEKPEALKEIDEIIKIADGIMIARGDLAVEVPQERMPLIQKDIVKRCIKQAKPVVVATQMMESMIESPTPTRAEITDVANAAIDGADAVMLSAETSTGKYPLKVIQVMSKILRNIEDSSIIYDKELRPDKNSPTLISDAICYNAARMGGELNARAIIGMTFSGFTGFILSSYRPKSHIYIFTENRDLLNTLSICWGVRAFYYKSFVGTDTTIRDVIRILKEKNLVEIGDIIINTGSMPLAQRGRTNMVKVTVVE
ncbi:MAG: pyruvate kinase [Chitinophagales bacterium]|nr:pyruvate kinase [Chitinophagales bacterium]MCO5279695.1 pyruvate kinase [Chitinophagales bacterium]OJV29161.1 MAG: pyruvate kinase [Bacteroidetes bacterium 37-13]HRP40176.1 pyruvate kinase [Chitinophagales bacterium]